MNSSGGALRLPCGSRPSGRRRSRPGREAAPRAGRDEPASRVRFESEQINDLLRCQTHVRNPRFERMLIAADRSRSGFSALVILLASAATTTDSSDHLSTGNNRDASDARKSLAA